VTRNGQKVGAISATVDRDRMIETVLSLGRRERGEIPFVLDAGGELHTIRPDAARTAREMDLGATARTALASSSTQLAGDWLIVTRRDPSGIVFGLARPIRESLRKCGGPPCGTSRWGSCSSLALSRSSCRWPPASRAT